MPELRDVAYELALGIALFAGARAETLALATPLVEILDWIGEEKGSLDQVDWLVPLDVDPAETSSLTFRALVERTAVPRERNGA